MDHQEIYELIKDRNPKRILEGLINDASHNRPGGELNHQRDKVYIGAKSVLQSLQTSKIEGTVKQLSENHAEGISRYYDELLEVLDVAINRSRMQI